MGEDGRTEGTASQRLLSHFLAARVVQASGLVAPVAAAGAAAAAGPPLPYAAMLYAPAPLVFAAFAAARAPSAADGAVEVGARGSHCVRPAVPLCANHMLPRVSLSAAGDEPSSPCLHPPGGSERGEEWVERVWMTCEREGGREGVIEREGGRE